MMTFDIMLVTLSVLISAKEFLFEGATFRGIQSSENPTQLSVSHYGARVWPKSFGVSTKRQPRIQITQFRRGKQDCRGQLSLKWILLQQLLVTDLDMVPAKSVFN